MYKQLDIFDFIEKPTDCKTQFEQLFEPIENPVCLCANCLCQYCTHNVEELYHTVKVEEAAKTPCFNCDECRVYTGEPLHEFCRMENCKKFIMSDYGAERNRRKLKSLGGKGK